MSRIQTLTMVVELAEQRRDEALTEHARRVRELQMAQEQMDQLQGYVLEAQARWAQRGSQGIDVTLLLHHRQFMQKIHHAIEFQTGVLTDKQARIDQALADLTPLPRPVCEFRHISTLIGFVDNGLGVAIVPQLTLPRPPASVVGVRLEHPSISRTIGLTQRTGRSLSPAAAAFAELITQASQATARPARRVRA